MNKNYTYRFFCMCRAKNRSFVCVEQNYRLSVETREQRIKNINRFQGFILIRVFHVNNKHLGIYRSNTSFFKRSILKSS